MSPKELLIWVSVGQLLSLAAVLVLHRRLVSRVLALFAFSVIAHLLAGSAIEWPGWIAPVLYIMALLPMPVFYLLCRSVFEDSFSFSFRLFGAAILSAVTAWIFLLFKPELMAMFPFGKPVLESMPQSVLSLFILAAFYTILRGRSSDLILWRYRLRIWVLSFIGVFALAIAVTEIYYSGHLVPVYLEVLKLVMILLSGFTLMLWLLVPREDLFSQPRIRTLGDISASQSSNNALLSGLQDSIRKDQVHHREGLTIGQMASYLNCQEYILRRLINRELGYPNFNQFLNAHRIQDAKEALKDRSQADKKILTLALELGYQSLAPFNLAFRNSTGETPTEFRKRHLHR